MTRPHLDNMEERERGKGDNRENYSNANESLREVTTINPGEMQTEDEGYGETEEKKAPRGESRNDKSQKIRIPSVTIQNPTPTPRQLSGKEKGKGKGDMVEGEVEDDDDDDDEDMDYDTGEEEEVEEEEEDTEMTPEEKQAMNESVKEGDIDALEDCLDLPNADINMIWFQENLLMTAIRAGNAEMAEFLVDNGVDHTYSTSRMVMKETLEGTKKLDRYEVDCRQMAFEYGMDDLVFLLDYLQGRLFSFVPAPKRTPRMRRPPPPITPTDSNLEEEGNSSDADISDTSSQQTPDEEQAGEENKESVMKQKRKRKKKRSKSKSENKTMTSDKDTGQGQEDDDVEEKDKTAWTASTFTEVDSGNYSMASGSKLKKSMLEQHNKLLELDLEGNTLVSGQNGGDIKSKTSQSNSPRKSNASAFGSENSRGKKSQSQSQKDQEGNGAARGADGEEGRTDTSRSKSLSLSTSVLSPDLPPPLPVVPYPPNDPIRFNRSTLSVQKSNNLRRFYTTPLNESNVDTPLSWKKVCTTGSYVMESKHWHRDSDGNNKSNDNNLSTPARSKLEIDRVTVTLDTSPLSSRKNETKSKSPSKQSSHSPRGVSATMSSASAQQRTNSSLLPPPPPSSTSPLTPSSNPPPPSSSSISPRPNTFSSSRSTSSTPVSILKSTQTSDENNSNNKHIRFSLDPAAAASNSKQAPRPSVVASYMRPTQSTITKQRLFPRFVDSYGGLDFHHVTAGRPQIFRLNLGGGGDRHPGSKMTSSSYPLTSSAANPKSNPQRRNHNAISFRS